MPFSERSRDTIPTAPTVAAAPSFVQALLPMQHCLPPVTHLVPHSPTAQCGLVGRRHVRPIRGRPSTCARRLVEAMAYREMQIRAVASTAVTTTCSLRSWVAAMSAAWRKLARVPVVRDDVLSHGGQSGRQCATLGPRLSLLSCPCPSSRVSRHRLHCISPR